MPNYCTMLGPQKLACRNRGLCSMKRRVGPTPPWGSSYLNGELPEYVWIICMTNYYSAPWSPGPRELTHLACRQHVLGRPPCSPRIVFCRADAADVQPRPSSEASMSVGSTDRTPLHASEGSTTAPSSATCKSNLNRCCAEESVCGLQASEVGHALMCRPCVSMWARCLGCGLTLEREHT